MVKHSAGLALIRGSSAVDCELLVVHPGGPFWAGKDEHGWSIPKGEFERPGAGDSSDEDLTWEAAAEAANREFAEELGRPAPVKLTGSAGRLGVVKTSGKWIWAFVAVADFDETNIVSNTTEIEWPPRSGRRLEIPEVDAAAWIKVSDAEKKLHKGQRRIAELIRHDLVMILAPSGEM